jgi:integrase
LAAAAKRGEGTLRALLDAYEADAGAQLRSWPHGRLRIERVFRGLMDQSLASITVEGILLAADAYRAKPSAAFAVRTLRPVLKWGAPRGFVSEGLAQIHRRDPQRRRRRVLDRAEFAALLPVLSGLQRPHAAALHFMLLTLARREEVCCARWQDVDLTTGLWTIPHTKNGEPHIVPLPRQAVELLLCRLPAGADGQRIQPDGAAFVFATSMGAPLGNWDRSTKSIQMLSGTSGWHRHDLRRTGATMLGELGVLPDIIEAALNHTAIHSPIAATYNRSRYRPQVAQVLQHLADELDRIARDRVAVALPSNHGDL